MSSKINFFDTTRGKALKVAVWVGISALLGYLLALATNEPNLWGVYTPIINVVLVTAKNLADKNVPN